MLYPSYMEVRYEDVVNHPVDHIREFFGLPEDVNYRTWVETHFGAGRQEK